MELESTRLSEISHSEKDKNQMILLICGTEEMKQMYIAEKKRTRIKPGDKLLTRGQTRLWKGRWAGMG